MDEHPTTYIYIFFIMVVITGHRVLDLIDYIEDTGSATKNDAAYPKHQEEEETPPNRNHIINET